ncbi:hypothetical protein E4U42_000220 [Claviceps africana]|uniref:Uncharacterized protein n=1 Tax=Claviceps africana TaxID=83212 RepID=A0A8K0J0H0_9HYPO|nr:hypothetical protein E4U42_000220 [Claviceps africana]
MDRTPESILVKSQTDMASSLESTRDCTPISVTTNKAIPLLCTVCPEAPRFSDVSHLLTHIASKGHLHHETQTKLKAHQDIAASVTLQQYERWYKDNGIETLLVERMRAKQKKEAVRNNRKRDSIPFAPSRLRQLKRKSRRTSQRSVVKAEEADFPADFSPFSGFSPSDNEVELDEESINGGDMLSLKGQVWPGMGKMDLANEDMKRTRNQRKPNSVIEKMRRISERIEPTQVVMTSKFEVERIKGVYESSSPIPDQEAETPKRAAKPKRKRPLALAEISVNVPRRGRRPSSRRNAAAKKASFVPKENVNDTLMPTVSDSSSFRHGHDVFRDEENRASGMAVGTLTLTPCLIHQLIVSELYGERLFTSSASHHDQSISGSTFSVTDSPMYNYGSRFQFASYSNVGVSGNDIFQFNPNHHLQQQAKHEAHPSPVHRDLLDGTSHPQFLHMSQSQSNPLFAQDRTIFGSYHIPEPVQPLSGLNMDSLSQSVEHNQTQANDREAQSTPVENIKIENSTEKDDGDMPGDFKHPGFADNEVWVNAETLDL